MVDLPTQIVRSTLLNNAQTVRNTKTDKNMDKSRTQNTTIGQSEVWGYGHGRLRECIVLDVRQHIC